MPTGHNLSPTVPPRREAAAFEPAVALAVLDGLSEGDAEAASAWDAAWIACVTGSPRWAETARHEFARATGRRGPPGP